MDGYTSNSTNDLVINNSMQINELKQAEYKVTTSMYDTSLAYLDHNNKVYDATLTNVKSINDSIKSINDKSKTASLSYQVGRIRSSIDALMKTQGGKLTDAQVKQYGDNINDLITTYAGEIPDATRLSVAINPLHQYWSGILGDIARTEMVDKLQNIMSEYRPMYDEDSLKLALKDANDPTVIEKGSALMGTEAWKAQTARSAGIWFKGMLSNLHIVDKTEIAKKVEEYKDILPPAVYKEYKENLDTVMKSQKYMQDNMGVSEHANKDAEAVETQIGVNMMSDIKKSGGNIKLVDMLGNINSKNSAQAIKLLAITYQGLLDSGQVHLWQALKDSNPEYYSALVNVEYGQFDKKNFTSLTGAPLINGTENAKRIRAGIDNALSDPNSGIEKLATSMSSAIINSSNLSNVAGGKGKGNSSSQDVYLRDTSITQTIDSVFTIGKTLDNMPDIQKMHDRQFIDWFQNNKDLVVAKLSKDADFNSIDFTRDSSGNFAKGTQESIIKKAYDIYRQQGSLSDIAKTNVINGFNAASDDLGKARKNDDVAKKLKNSDFKINTFQDLNVYLTSAFGKGYTITSAGGHTFVKIDQQTYDLNNKDQAKLLFTNAFNILDAQRIGLEKQRAIDEQKRATAKRNADLGFIGGAAV